MTERAEHHLNWIGGGWRTASGGLTFELGGTVWPRSTAEDVAAALDASSRAAPHWAELDRTSRRAVFARAADELERDTELTSTLASSLGLDTGEFAPRHADEIYRAREDLELLAEGEARAGTGVFQAHWSDFAGGLFDRVAARAVAGECAVVIADPRLPFAGGALARALERADLPRGVVSVLHDDGDTSLHAALSSSIAWARLRGHEQRLQRLRDRFRAHAGEGWSFWPLLNRSHAVSADADLSAQAAVLAEQSLGRSATLGGQIPGQIARVLCPQQLFSRLCEELLARLSADPDAQRPVPAIDADLIEYVRGAWALGLDEGATPLLGWESARSGKERTGFGSSSDPRAAATPRLFVNVEARSRLAHLRRPAPVLSLIRAVDHDAARELAREFDASSSL